MFYAAAIAIGMVISIMVNANGLLQQGAGTMAALIVVHAIGLAVSLTVIAVRRERPGPLKGVPPVYFLAGVVGVGILFLNNLTFASLGVTLTVSLGVLGQFVASSLIDHFGWFGLPRRPFGTDKALGSFLILGGIALMAFPR